MCVYMLLCVRFLQSINDHCLFVFVLRPPNSVLTENPLSVCLSSCGWFWVHLRACLSLASLTTFSCKFVLLLRLIFLAMSSLSIKHIRVCGCEGGLGIVGCSLSFCGGCMPSFQILLPLENSLVLPLEG